MIEEEQNANREQEAPSRALPETRIEQPAIGRQHIEVGDSDGCEQFISKVEVGRLLGISERTVDAWMARGLIPYVKAGRAVRFRWSRVVSHLENKFEVKAN